MSRNSTARPRRSLHPVAGSAETLYGRGGPHGARRRPSRPPRPADKDITRMDQHTKRGIAELCQTHRLTRLYAARRPLTCRGCGAPIATNELFTRTEKGADGSNPRPLCRRCRPFAPRPDLDLGRSSRILALPKTPGQWLVFIVTLGICAWHGLLAGVLVGVALATALVVVPRLARRWRRRRTTV
jgi:hypothetical protein